MAYTEIMTWRVVLEQDSDSGDWAAWCPELPGCASAGVDREDAIVQIREAILLYITPEIIPLDPDYEILEVAV